MARLLRKVLVVRNDRLGDLMLAYPTFLLLKQALPQTLIHALVPGYTSEMARCCRGVDSVLLDPGPHARQYEQMELLRQLRKERYDAILSLYSTLRVGALAFLARIPYRLAPATKLAQLFYNKRLVQRRSRSAKPEYEYNLELGLKLLSDFGVTLSSLPEPPFLQFPLAEIASLRRDFCRLHGISDDSLLVFVHPGSGGSAKNLSVEQFATLACNLRSTRDFTIVITAGPGEEANAVRLQQLLKSQRAVVHVSRQGIERFAKHIQFADLFISGSTGPLHVAGALDRPTAAFYTRRRSATCLRWRTLNREERRLAFMPPQHAAEDDMNAIDLVRAAQRISARFLQS
jgi:ADP-heptose:LPS heptosyltransferase